MYTEDNGMNPSSSSRSLSGSVHGIGQRIGGIDISQTSRNTHNTTKTSDHEEEESDTMGPTSSESDQFHKPHSKKFNSSSHSSQNGRISTASKEQIAPSRLIIDQYQTKRRMIYGISLVVLLGCFASFVFLGISISSARQEEQGNFRRDAEEMTKQVSSAWQDYLHSSLWVNEACHNRVNTTRNEFHGLYKYLQFGGLNVQGISCIQNITHDNREELEEESRVYYEENYPKIDYRGITGYDEQGILITPRSEQPYYNVMAYVEPVEANERALGFDIGSSQTHQEAVSEALTTSIPALTGRILLSNDGDDDNNDYAVHILSPGIPTVASEDGRSAGGRLALLSVPVQTVLQRAAQRMQIPMTVYLYDSTNTTNEPTFLGGIEVHIHGSGIEYNPAEEMELEDLLELASENEEGVEASQQLIDVSNTRMQVVVVPVQGTYEASLALPIVGGVLIFFIVLSVSRWLYINMLRTHEIALIQSEAQAEKEIVNSLFPTQIRNRLIKEHRESSHHTMSDPLNISSVHSRRSTTSLRGSMSSDFITNRSAHLSSEGIFGSKPIADFFPEVTVMFADLAGFTAWSSEREPTLVFTLLEVIFHTFDQVAKKFRIFKLETVADCYVAVSGLPEARVDHAVAMSRFATDCLLSFRHVTSSMEVSMGPDTADLGLRIGLHSGPVTAGVLRGEKGRFQLFGDTMNTCSRIEASGERFKIHASSQTAAYLRTAGKGEWLTKRQDTIYAKGKGALETYWVKVKASPLGIVSTTPSDHKSNMDLDDAISETPSFADDDSIKSSPELTSGEFNHAQDMHDEDDKRIERLKDWNVAVFARLIQLIMARRLGQEVDDEGSERRLFQSHKNSRTTALDVMAFESVNGGGTVLDEVKDIIMLPKFDSSAFANPIQSNAITLDPAVLRELRDFISVIADMYRNNPFHNFEHASHVLMSVLKLLSRIVNPNEAAVRQKFNKEKEEEAKRNQKNGKWNYTLDEEFDDATATEAQLHDYTFGITSDPLTHFACAFSALVHDVDHPGVPNTTLVKEETDKAMIYKNKSVAEQNSVDLAWDLLTGPEYKNLLHCVCGDQSELARFRQLVVNMVMATDVMDKDLGAKRKARWDKAFASFGSSRITTVQEDVNRKATIVIEHLIQASDVSHTMQHWHVYRKWNERLFHEMYHAYKSGRLDTDPSERWYDGELGFFDFYVIPLAKKLDTCGVFGVSSDELLNYALENRKEWAKKGKDIVESYLGAHQDALELSIREGTSLERSIREGASSEQSIREGPAEPLGLASHPSEVSLANLSVSYLFDDRKT